MKQNRSRKQLIRLPAILVADGEQVNSRTRGAWRPKYSQSFDSTCRLPNNATSASTTGTATTATTSAMMGDSSSDNELLTSAAEEHRRKLPAIVTTGVMTTTLTTSNQSTSDSDLDFGTFTTGTPSDRQLPSMGGDVAFLVRSNRHVKVKGQLQQSPRPLAGSALRDSGLAPPPSPSASPGSTSNRKRTSTPSLEEFDQDAENLRYSLLMPTIEAILQEEGINSRCIALQMAGIKERCKQRRYKDNSSRGDISNRKQSYDDFRKNKEDKTVVGGLDSIPAKIRHSSDSGLSGLMLSSDKCALPVPTTTSANNTANTTTTTITSNRGSHIRSIERCSTPAAQKELAQFQDEIERTKWLSRQQIEIVSVGDGFVLPKIVVIPNNIKGGASLFHRAIGKRSDIIKVNYDFSDATYDSIIIQIRRKLDQYKDKCRARSIMFYCQGGPGYVYMLKKKILTPQKLRKQHDLQKFWKDLSYLLTMIEPLKTLVHFTGCNLLEIAQGQDLMSDITKLMYPNIVTCQAIDHTDIEAEKTVIEMYMEWKNYLKWKDIVCAISRKD